MTTSRARELADQIEEILGVAPSHVGMNEPMAKTVAALLRRLADIDEASGDVAEIEKRAVARQAILDRSPFALAEKDLHCDIVALLAIVKRQAGENKELSDKWGRDVLAMARQRNDAVEVGDQARADLARLTAEHAACVDGEGNLRRAHSLAVVRVEEAEEEVARLTAELGAAKLKATQCAR